MASKKNKKLTKSKNRKLAGVCGGIGDFFGVDPVLVRLIWIVATAMTGFVPGILAYLLAAWVMPES